MSGAQDRSVRDNVISNSAVITGDNNTVTQHVFPPAAGVDAVAELAALRTLLGTMAIPDATKLGRALDDAAEDAAKPEPEKAEVAGALGRIVGYAKKAADFGTHVATLTPMVEKLCGWLGEHGPKVWALLKGS